MSDWLWDFAGWLNGWMWLPKATLVCLTVLLVLVAVRMAYLLVQGTDEEAEK